MFIDGDDNDERFGTLIGSWRIDLSYILCSPFIELPANGIFRDEASEGSDVLLIPISVIPFGISNLFFVEFEHAVLSASPILRNVVQNL